MDIKKTRLLSIISLLIILANCNAQDFTNDPKIIELLQKLPFSLTHYLDSQNGKIVSSISQTYNVSHYLYGGSRTLDYTIKLQEDDNINPVIWYNLIMASANKTSIKIEAVLEKSGSSIVLGEYSYTLDSNNFLQYVNYFILDEPIKIDEGDLFIFRITGKGSDFGIYFGPNESRIIFSKPSMDINETVLSERSKLLAWMLKNQFEIPPNEYTNELKNGLIFDFYTKIDYLIVNNKNCTWNLGAKMTKDEKPFQITWKDNIFSLKELSQAEYENLKLNDNSIQTIQE